jgi:hypothetical protein
MHPFLKVPGLGLSPESFGNFEVGEFVVPIEGRYFGILTDETANRGGCFVTLGNGKRAVSVLGDSMYSLQNNLNM